MKILDASALLAYLLDEPGADVVEAAIADRASIGAVNLAEVLSKLADADQEPGTAMVKIRMLPLEVIPFDENTAVETARLRPLTSGLGLSLGDRACLAVGRIREEPVLTTDATWQDALPGLEVSVIR